VLFFCDPGAVFEAVGSQSDFPALPRYGLRARHALEGPLTLPSASSFFSAVECPSVFPIQVDVE